MLAPTPGVKYLTVLLLKAAAFFYAVYVTPDALLRLVGSAIVLPRWFSPLLAATSLVAFPYAHAQVRDLRAARACRALGGAPIPRLRGSWGLNLDIIFTMINGRETGYPGDFIEPWIHSHGTTFDLNVIQDHQVFTCDPENIKAVLATDFPSFEKGPKFDFAVGQVLGTGVFNSDGEMWKFHRSMTRPFFNRERITDFEIFARHADEAIAKIKERLRAGLAVDVQDLTSRFTLDSATEFLFGSCVHSLSGDLPYPYGVPKPADSAIQPSKADLFANAFNAAQMAVAQRAWIGPIWPLWEIFEDKAKEHMKVIDAYLNPILRAGVEKNKRAVAPGSDPEQEAQTLLDDLVRSTTDEKVIKDELMNVMIAGRDTTAATLSFAVYFLALHPAILARLRAEILGKFGLARIPTYESLRSLKLLRAVINETLRLFPSVAFNVRKTIQGTLLASKDATGRRHFVPPHTNVAYSVLVLHRRKDLWGDDADEFDPDRFIDERLKLVTSNPFIFLPFNAGPRICLGQQFAYNEISLFLVRLLQSFKSIELAPEAVHRDVLPPARWASSTGRKGIERIWPAAHLTMYSKGGMWATMQEETK